MLRGPTLVLQSDPFQQFHRGMNFYVGASLQELKFTAKREFEPDENEVEAVFIRGLIVSLILKKHFHLRLQRAFSGRSEALHHLRISNSVVAASNGNDS